MRIKDLIPWAHREEEARPAASEQHPVVALQREMNRLFDGFFGRIHHPFASADGQDVAGWAVADVVETDDHVEVSVELPGLDEKDLDVTVAPDGLTIRGEKRVERQEEKKGFYLSERSYGSVFRSIPLPPGVDCDRAEARFGNGVLTVTLPKSAQAQVPGRKIAIKAA
ncbi:MAG: Hsp20/alpha crystallin family protein [Gammaproteobacteria bacterium]|nr:Hsp20/alpha crystallin family protein [Gammaproteobacteria bacterium]